MQAILFPLTIATRLTAADAGTYTLTVAMTSGNYTWRGENTAPSAAPPDVELTWTIGKAQNVINAEETYAGWTYGNRPTGTDTLDASLAFTQDGQTIAYTYYAASDSGRETPVTISATTPAGDYVLVLSVADSGQYRRGGNRAGRSPLPSAAAPFRRS